MKLILWSIFLSVQAFHDGRETASVYSNEWVVHVEGDEEAADILADTLGYQNLGGIDGFENYYLLRKLDHPDLNRDESAHHTRSLENEFQVLYAQQLFDTVRVKRFPATEEEIRIPQELMNLWDEVENPQGSMSKISGQVFADPQWNDQWYLHEKLSRDSDASSDRSLHVIPNFNHGYTGQGIKIVVLDDGLEHTHPDIISNYEPSISYDFNDNDPDPTPRQPKGVNEYPNSHGTRCAGEIAMTPNNSFCGVGVAYGAKIGAIRMLDGRIDDRVEGLSLQHALDQVDIFTASWGPTDDGRTVEGPSHLARAAIQKGISQGRRGLGTIYVWASGNGGLHGDNCNCDGYTSSMYTISIGSVTSNDKFPWYGEKCSSTLAVTYSSGNNDEPKIATTDVNAGCTVGHTGTSASAPLAAGIIALALEANSKLTWRDVQHLIIHTSVKGNLEQNPGWFSNAAGLVYNHRFGFGLLNAESLVEAAKNHQNVNEAQECHLPVLRDLVNVKPGTTETILMKVDCPTIKYLEHTLLTLTLDTRKRGNLEIVLESAQNDFSQLLTPRAKDRSTQGFQNWTFQSLHFWGTDPNGIFKLHIINHDEKEGSTAKLRKVDLTLHGTATIPSIMEINPSLNGMFPNVDSISVDTPTSLEEFLTMENGSKVERRSLEELANFF